MSRLRHPPLQPGWIDRPHHTLPLGDLVLESGDCIHDFQLSYVVHGPPGSQQPQFADPSRPVVLALSAISSTHHRLDFLIGPNRALDPGQMTIIAVDAIGNGLSTSPSNSTRQPGEAFPRFTIRDMVASQCALLDHLGIERLHAVIGASMGGMQALQWAVSHPARVGSVIAMTPMARASAWSVAINETSRRALHAVSREGASAWAAWVPLMQLLSARTPMQLDQAFGSPDEVLRWIEARTRWWIEQEFDPIDWIYQTHAYDAHDLGTTPGFGGDTDAALRSIRQPALILAPPLDLYNPAEAARHAASLMPHARFAEIPSNWGHQAASGADPVATRFVESAINDFLACLR